MNKTLKHTNLEKEAERSIKTSELEWLNMSRSQVVPAPRECFALLETEQLDGSKKIERVPILYFRVDLNDNFTHGLPIIWENAGEYSHLSQLDHTHRFWKGIEVYGVKQ